MPATGLGVALKMFRERRTLSQRELGELSEVDNAYISRLEQGEKVNPTPETVTKLLRTLKVPERDASILRWLANHPNTSPELVAYTLETAEVPFDHFVSAAGMSFRGDARPAPDVLLAKVRRLYEEDGE